MKCEDTKKVEVASPSGKHKVIVFERDCGATTPISTIVALVPADSTFDGEKSSRLFVIRGPAHIKVSWKSNKEALVQYPAGLEEDIFTKEAASEGIAIVYEGIVGH